MTGNNGGPWGGGGGSGGGGSGGGGSGGGGDNRGGKRPGDGPQLPEIEELVKKGQEQLRVLMGGRGGNRGPGGTGGPIGPIFTRRTVGIGAAVLVALWGYASFYTVQQDERSVELLFGSFSSIGEPGLNFAPWPVVRAEILPVTTERTENIGDAPGARANSGLMLTSDEAIVDIEFQVVYNISDPRDFLFNLADPQETVRAVAESAMRDIIARSELSPILNRDRASIAADLQTSVQTTLD